MKAMRGRGLAGGAELKGDRRAFGFELISDRGRPRSEQPSPEQCALMLAMDGACVLLVRTQASFCACRIPLEVVSILAVDAKAQVLQQAMHAQEMHVFHSPLWLPSSPSTLDILQSQQAWMHVHDIGHVLMFTLLGQMVIVLAMDSTAHHLAEG